MNNKTFGTKISVEARGMGETKNVEFKAENVKPFKSANKIDNVINNVAEQFTQHANAINAIAFWIAEQDKEVAEAGNVTTWATNKVNARERLTHRQQMARANAELKKNFPRD